MKYLLYSLALAVIVSPKAALAKWNSAAINREADLPEGRIIDIIMNIMDWLLAIVGIIGIIGFVISGILYLTAAGDSNQAGRAKSAMTYSIIGVIVALMGFVIILAADAMLGGSKTF